MHWLDLFLVIMRLSQDEGSLAHARGLYRLNLPSQHPRMEHQPFSSACAVVGWRKKRMSEA